MSKESASFFKPKNARRLRAAEQISTLRALFSVSLIEGDYEAMAERARALNIPLADAAKAQAWLQSEFPDIHARSRGDSKGQLRILLDENLPYALAPQLHAYGYVSSVFMKGLSGKQDVFVYGYARLRDKFHAIITRDRAQKPDRVGIDRDLTNIALDRVKAFFRDKPLNEESLAAAKNFPQIIHLPSKNPYRDGTVDTFRNQFDAIYKHVQRHDYHIIQVTPSGVCPKQGTSLTELWDVANHKEPVASDPVAFPNKAAKLFKYMKRLAGRQNQDINQIMGFVRADVLHEFDDLIKSKRDISQEKILTLIKKTLQRVSENYPGVSGHHALVIFEMVLKAMQKSADEQVRKKLFDRQNYNTPS